MRKYFWFFALIFLGLAGCQQYVEGELAPLLDSREEGGDEYEMCCAYWSSDGSKVYFLSNWGDYTSSYADRVWSKDVDDGTMTQISDDSLEIWEFEVSHQDDLCIPYFSDQIYVYDLGDWTQVYSTEKPGDMFGNPRFSIESSQIMYYIARTSDSIHLHKMNWIDSTDQIVFSGDGGYPVIPGPGDSLFVIGQYIHNLNSGEKISFPNSGVVDWNPAKSTELVYGDYDNLVLFDIETGKQHFIDVRSTNLSHIKSARFSSDGQKIVFTGYNSGDLSHRAAIWIWDRDGWE